MSDLDEFLSGFTDAVTYDSEAAAAMNTVRLRMPDDLPVDPFSHEYHQYQMNLYSMIAGKRYSLANESIPFDVERAAETPFPYSSQNCKTVGVQLTAIGALLRAMELSPGDRVLEFGAGWGNTSIALARSGFQVTAVDLEARFCDLIDRRARAAGVAISTVNEDFFWIERYIGEPFDAIVFFECFHHCADHLRLLRSLQRALKPNGKVYFGAEPITNGLPMPWGVRLDGESLWAIRKHGWLELGFTQDYFTDALLATGWSVTANLSNDHFAANVWVAERFDGRSLSFHANDERILSPTARRTHMGLALEDVSGAWGFHGPYASIPPGDWAAKVHIDLLAEKDGVGILDICSDNGKIVHAFQEFNFQNTSSTVSVAFSIKRPIHRAEIRLFCSRNISLNIETVEFVRQ